ncbi:MAG: radical SAM protein, partial [Actinomycetota bacterium]|nr:radical SAM protein [Actinomycetota bacterium]
QSGSDRVLKEMRRSYRSAKFLGIIERVRAAMPEAAITTDIIVGFPGETDEDFDATLDMVRDVAFDHAFTFIYSPREGTSAAALTDSVPRALAQKRFDRLAQLVRELSFASNEREIGAVRACLIEGSSKRDESVLSARTPENRLVHVPVDSAHTACALAGTVADIRITGAHPWFLTGELAGRPVSES